MTGTRPLTWNCKINNIFKRYFLKLASFVFTYVHCQIRQSVTNRRMDTVDEWIVGVGIRLNRGQINSSGRLFLWAASSFIPDSFEGTS